MQVRVTSRGTIAAIAVVAALACAPAAAGGRAADRLPEPGVRALAAHGHALVALRGGPRAERLAAADGGRLVSAPLRLWRVAGARAPALVASLERGNLLRYAEPDRPRRPHGHLELGDPLVAEAWHLARIGADRAEPPGPGAPVALVDTGIDLAHPEFATRPDLVLLNENVAGAFGASGYHGTVVASTAGAPADGIGTVGVYPRVALHSFDLARLEDSDIIAGIDAAVRQGRGVISLSLGGPGFSRSLYEAVMRAVDAGSLVVAAAGNGYLRGNPVVYPASFPHVLTVGATDLLDQPAIFTSESRAVDLAAPGVAIPVQHPEDPKRHATYRGTSVSAPMVAAAAAWVWTVRPELDATQVAELLRRSARDVGGPGFDRRAGFGLLDIPAALARPAPPSDPLEPNDDVDLVARRGVLAASKPPLTAPRSGRTRLLARLDAAEDPVDVYRIVVPPGRTLVATVLPDRDVGLALWHARTRTVAASGRAARRDRLARSDRRGRRTEQVRWRNHTGRAVVVYVEVRLPGRSVHARAGYRLVLRTAR